jgi:uncharacterized protein involved in type VI secretion and phage assembly
MDTTALLDRLLAQRAAAPGPGACLGVVVGIVTNNRDPEGLHRVKLRFPWLADDDESHWARVASPMSGGGRGLYLLPEVDDEVLVAFAHGSVEFPFVLGALWNGRDAPPENNADGRNDRRSLTSRSGHVLRMTDTQGQETIELVDASGNNRLVIETASNRIRIEAQGDIELASATGKVKISGVGIELDSMADVKVQAQTTVDVQATAQASVQGALVKVN